jgi:hypothetical protein
LRVCDDVSPGAWIATRLTGEIGTVTGTVPSGYPAYVRICHPAPDQGRAPVSWAEVARTTGRQVHPLMQWHALVGSRDHLNMRGSLWRGGNPKRGDLAPEVLGPLCALLGEGHTGDAGRCYFGLWEGWGWEDGSASRPRGLRPAMPRPRRLAFPTCRLSRVSHRIGQSPNLFWPADRAWCVASEIDFDSTLLGGTVDLIGAILHSPTFDAWPVVPADSLTLDADQINKVD